MHKLRYKSGVSSNAQTFKSTHTEAISEDGTQATTGTCGPTCRKVVEDKQAETQVDTCRNAQSFGTTRSRNHTR